MTGEPLRCHPSIMVENTLQLMLSVGIVVLLFGRLDISLVAAIGGTALVLAILFSYWRWKKTLIIFKENEVIIERDTLFKLKKVLPYSKIAAVNVNRGVVNRVFGTSKLMININSGYNAIVPEAALTFKQDMTDRLRDEMSSRLYKNDLPTEEEDIVPVASFSPLDVVVHSLFSVPTPQTLVGAFFLANSILEMYTSTVEGLETGGAAIPSLLMFFLVQIVPSTMQLFRYYNFKVYRKGDTIYLQHGLVRSYKTSFPINKVNAVRVKSTLASRLVRRSCIEAEVVGIASGDGKGSTRPVICLLKNDATTQQLLRELAPEFVHERRPSKQPAGARSVLYARAGLASLLLAAAMVYPTMIVFDRYSDQPGIVGAVPYLLPLFTALIILASFHAARVSYRVREIDTGEEVFTFVNGILDRETVIMSYDKVQMVHVIKGPLARRFDVSWGKVYMLSSIGGKVVPSGLFSEAQLNRIIDIIMDRMASGKYDHRLSGI